MGVIEQRGLIFFARREYYGLVRAATKTKMCFILGKSETENKNV